jgi:putative transcriptional regulator
MNALQGKLLIARPGSRDWDRFKTVALVLRHDARGATGLVLNRPLATTVSRVWGEACGELAACHEPLYLGGPAPGAFSALHCARSLGEAEVADGIFCSTELSLIRQLAAQRAQPIRFFAGCLDWSSDRLDEELRRRSWQLAPVSRDALFAESEGLWEQLERATNRPTTASLAAPPR